MEKSRGKNRRKTLSLKQKADVIRRIDQRESYGKISEVHHMSKAQVENIKKNKENINSILDNGASEEIKKLRKPDYPITDEEAMKFVKWWRSQRMPVPTAILTTSQ